MQHRRQGNNIFPLLQQVCFWNWIVWVIPRQDMAQIQCNNSHKNPVPAVLSGNKHTYNSEVAYHRTRGFICSGPKLHHVQTPPWCHQPSLCRVLPPQVGVLGSSVLCHTWHPVPEQWQPWHSQRRTRTICLSALSTPRSVLRHSTRKALGKA